MTALVLTSTSASRASFVPAGKGCSTSAFFAIPKASVADTTRPSVTEVATFSSAIAALSSSAVVSNAGCSADTSSVAASVVVLSCLASIVVSSPVTRADCSKLTSSLDIPTVSVSPNGGSSVIGTGTNLSAEGVICSSGEVV